MLGDLNTWLRSGLEYILPGGWSDTDFKEALSNCYTAICYNKYHSGKMFCPLKLDDVGAVIISYIAYFTMSENVDSKYYYDEYSDRKDPYRKSLIALLTKGSQAYNRSISEGFVNEVLSYLYWSMKRNKCPKVILRPKGEQRFMEHNWYIKEPYRSIISITERTYNLMLNVFKVTLNAVESAVDSVSSTLDWSLFLLKNLPYILTGGVLLIAGFQVYGIRKNGRFYGADILKKQVGF